MGQWLKKAQDIPKWHKQASPKKISQTGLAFWKKKEVTSCDTSQPRFVQVVTYCNLGQFLVKKSYATEKRRLRAVIIWFIKIFAKIFQGMTKTWRRPWAIVFCNFCPIGNFAIRRNQDEPRLRHIAMCVLLKKNKRVSPFEKKNLREVSIGHLGMF